MQHVAITLVGIQRRLIPTPLQLQLPREMACSWRALSVAIDEIRWPVPQKSAARTSAEVENSVALAVGVANQTVWNAPETGQRLCSVLVKLDFGTYKSLSLTKSHNVSVDASLKKLLALSRA